VLGLPHLLGQIHTQRQLHQTLRKDTPMDNKELQLEIKAEQHAKANTLKRIRKTHGKTFDDWSQFDTQGMDDHGE
jgi:hypothetical protein